MLLGHTQQAMLGLAAILRKIVTLLFYDLMFLHQVAWTDRHFHTFFQVLISQSSSLNFCWSVCQPLQGCNSSGIAIGAGGGGTD